jgi:hypothetical protein
MAEVRLAVDVINRGGDEKLFVHWDKQCDEQRRPWQCCAVRERNGNRTCRKGILRYNAGRLWRKTSRQTKTA